MRLSELKIENFRGIRSGHLRFRNHAVLIGPNNCGKTTIIEALALLFGRDRIVRNLTEHDFYGSDPQPADRIQLTGTITGFEHDDPAEHTDWFRDERAVPKWLDLDTGQVHPQRDRPAWRLACQIAFAARFDRPSLEVETVRYFHDDDAVSDIFDDEARTLVPTRLIRDIGFFLVPANRTWDRIISFGSELFRRIVASGAGPPAEAVLVERNRLRLPQQALEADTNLAPIVNELNEELSGFFQSRPKLQLRLTSTDSDGVLEAVVPHYRDGNDRWSLPARRQGSGLVSLQGLLLLLQLARRRAEKGDNFWIALEEPELHVPPALQRRLLYRLQALSTQTFVSTHSPMVAALSDPEALTILRNNGGQLSCTPFQEQALAASTPNAIRKLFHINRIDTISALMHEAVLVPEGFTDFEWLRLILRSIDARQNWSINQECRFGAYVGLIPTHDAAVVVTHQTLSRLHPRVCCLIDGDADGVAYARSLVQLPSRPPIVARWPDGWSIEDVVSWIVDADASAILEVIADSIKPAPASSAELVTRLKCADRAANGLKRDQLAYQGIADAIAASDACVNRARKLMNSLADLLLGQQTSVFAASQGEDIGVWIFQP